MRHDAIITSGGIGLTRDPACHVAEKIAPLIPHAIPARPVAPCDLQSFEWAA